MNWFKENWFKVVLAIIIIGLSFWSSDIFFIIIFVYGMAVYLLAKKSISKKVSHFLSVTIWAAFILVFGLIIYVNYWLPHGPSYPTGEFVCYNDDRGPCEEEYKEDLEGLNIPSWAKFLRNSGGFLLLFGLGIPGLIVTVKNRYESENAQV